MQKAVTTAVLAFITAGVLLTSGRSGAAASVVLDKDKLRRAARLSTIVLSTNFEFSSAQSFEAGDRQQERKRADTFGQITRLQAQMNGRGSGLRPLMYSKRFFGPGP